MAADAKNLISGKQKNTGVEKESPSYYVGIGASAGGLEALQEFFQLMPSDSGAAFIVVQHLSPNFKSVAGELLAHNTKMNVFTATDSMLVVPNTIYLAPPRTNMMIAEGRLLLANQMPDCGISFPIDNFFRALAEDRQHCAIGIVLSGTGSDGSRGIRAIKEVGGLIFVQEPESAKFDGMPYNAVKTGVADIILPVKKIPEKLLSCISHPLISGSGGSLVNYIETNDAVLTEIFALLKQHREVDFTFYKGNTVARRIERRIGINQLTTLQEYHSLLIRNPQEISILAKDMLIGVTRFFRDPEAFDLLKSVIIPNILDTTPIDEPIRIWVAGCASGEEAYSVAIIFDELLRERQQTHTVKIFATDVDPDAIRDASQGTYPASSVADINEERLTTYFRADKDKDEHFTILPAIRQMVIFAVHNLMKDPPFSNTRLVICRNVLIYFQPEAQRRVLSMLHFSLQTNSYLFLGSSESLGNLKSYFKVTNDRYRLYKKVSDLRVATNTTISIRENTPDTLPSMTSLLRNYKTTDKTVPFAAITDSLIAQYAPPCIVLDGQLDVTHVFGDVGAFTRKIKPGKFSPNIKDIIQEDLSIALSTAIHRAQLNEEDVTYDEIKVTQPNGNFISVSMKIQYVTDPRIPGFNILVLFENQHEISQKDSTAIISYDVDDQRRQRIQDLESELHKNQEHMQVMMEELGTTNEELQSSNEELSAANEELQSTNEELQSVNEELYTVNSEYQEKIDELTQVNTDLDNIIKSTTVGIVFLDEAMLIRKYTPACTTHINLLSSDLGRPFHHIAHNLSYDMLLTDIASVIEKAQPIEKEVPTNSGGVVVVSIAPYYTERDQTAGCVLALTDVTDLSNLKSALHESYQELRATINQSFMGNTEPLRILVVDDNKIDRDIINRYLDQSSPQFQIVEADSGTTAKALLMTSEFDVCFIDQYLGSITALELIAHLPTECRNKTFVLISGQVDESIKETALHLGVYDVISKSELTPALLERSIHYALVYKRTEMYLAQHVNEPKFPN